MLIPASPSRSSIRKRMSLITRAEFVVGVSLIQK
jgi:hypothetical protein